MTVETVTPKRRFRGRPRGRDLPPVALASLRQLLGDERKDAELHRRDLLIEHLHAIQDAHGHLSLVNLRALAAYMNLPMAAVYETATFYAHFDVVHDDQEPPPETTIRVCDSLSCQLAGAAALEAELKAGVDPARVRVVRAPCMGRCETAPVVEVGHHHVLFATREGVESVVDTGHFHPEAILWQRLDDYRERGGYRLLADCRAGKVTVETLMQTLEAANLRGLGGAGPELGPELHDGTLYFGSARPGGKGGLDLYRAKAMGAGFDHAQPLGTPFNSAESEGDPRGPQWSRDRTWRPGRPPARRKSSSWR